MSLKCTSIKGRCNYCKH